MWSPIIGHLLVYPKLPLKFSLYLGPCPVTNELILLCLSDHPVTNCVVRQQSLHRTQLVFDALARDVHTLELQHAYYSETPLCKSIK